MSVHECRFRFSSHQHAHLCGCGRVCLAPFFRETCRARSANHAGMGQTDSSHDVHPYLAVVQGAQQSDLPCFVLL
eukprot:m.49829 g.49829  ORF g.49829 m.49829 type:complete len:75 (-) comp11520_c1_seq1:46-270(-)